MSPAAFEPIAEQLLTVFSHMFQCIPLHRALLADPERFLESPSKVGRPRVAGTGACCH